MKARIPPIPAEGSVSVPSADIQTPPNSGRSVATRDRHVIQTWAARHGAQPATGEATTSGPATVDVNDGGVGVRFNFPGLGRFRPISWDEWFEHFDTHNLVFIYEEEIADRAYELWLNRGGEHGSAEQDWLDAERQLRGGSGSQGGRYSFVQQTAEQTRR